MASSIFIASPILLLILFHLLLANEPVSVLSRTTETRFHFPVNTTRASSSNASNESLVKANLEEVYSMNLTIGTPPKKIRVVMDTGSDLIWIKCNSDSNFPSPFYDTSMSSSFSKVDESCDELGLSGCQQKYQNGMSVNLSLGRDTLTNWDNKEHSVIFACGIPSTDFPYDGIVGLGQGKLSLVSQANLTSITYCIPVSKGISAFPNFNNFQPQIMPLLQPEDKSYYYISLEGISVGETRLPVTNVDFAINANGDGGMIIDSGAMFTCLERRIVDMIYHEFLNQTKLKRYDGDNAPQFSDLEYCFNTPYNVEIMPKLIFHFKGVLNSANWELPSEYYIYEKDGLACLAIVANGENETVSIFGYWQQQSMLVIYALEKNYLVFTPSICNCL